MTRRPWIIGAIGFALGVFVTILLERVYARGGFLKDTLDSVTRPPITPTKVLFYVAALLILVALPLGIAEWRAERAFRRLERELRATRPADDVAPYEGAEGRGLVFDGPGGRVLLLEGSGGLAAPRIVELPPLEPQPAPPESATAP